MREFWSGKLESGEAVVTDGMGVTELGMDCSEVGLETE